MWERAGSAPPCNTAHDRLAVEKESPPTDGLFTSAAGQKLRSHLYDLLVLSRFTKYNPVLATLSGRT